MNLGIVILISLAISTLINIINIVRELKNNRYDRLKTYTFLLVVLLINLYFFGKDNMDALSLFFKWLLRFLESNR